MLHVISVFLHPDPAACEHKCVVAIVLLASPNSNAKTPSKRNGKLFLENIGAIENYFILPSFAKTIKEKISIPVFLS